MTIEFTITNRKGQVFQCLIDDEDADLLTVKWKTRPSRTSSCHIQRGNETSIQMHRIILSRMLGRELERHEQVDHWNLNGLDNTRGNLRLATHSQNQANRKVQKNNKLGVKGVVENGNKYRARIDVNGKCIHLGLFDTLEQARNAYIEAAKKYHGEFARWD